MVMISCQWLRVFRLHSVQDMIPNLGTLNCLAHYPHVQLMRCHHKAFAFASALCMKEGRWELGGEGGDDL